MKKTRAEKNIKKGVAMWQCRKFKGPPVRIFSTSVHAKMPEFGRSVFENARSVLQALRISPRSSGVQCHQCAASMWRTRCLHKDLKV